MIGIHAADGAWPFWVYIILPERRAHARLPASALEERRSQIVLAIGQLAVTSARGSIHAVSSSRSRQARLQPAPATTIQATGTRVRLSYKLRGKTVPADALRRPLSCARPSVHGGCVPSLPAAAAPELVAVNERICQLRPVEELAAAPQAPVKKTVRAIQDAVSAEPLGRLLRVIVSARRKDRRVRLRQRCSRRRARRCTGPGRTSAGRAAGRVQTSRASSPLCHCGHAMRCEGAAAQATGQPARHGRTCSRARLLSLSPLLAGRPRLRSTANSLSRAAQYLAWRAPDARCGRWRNPVRTWPRPLLAELAGVEVSVNGASSARRKRSAATSRRRPSRTGGKRPCGKFAAAARRADLHALHQRWTAPASRSRRQRPPGVAARTARWRGPREVKLGCIFTQTARDPPRAGRSGPESSDHLHGRDRGRRSLRAAHLPRGLHAGACSAPAARSCSATERHGSGTWPTCTSESRGDRDR